MKYLTISLVSVLLLSYSCKSDTTSAIKDTQTEINDSPASRTTPVDKTEVRTVSVEEAIQLAAQGYRFVDCRTPEETAQGKIEGALEMNVKSYTYAQTIRDSLSQEDKLILYCQSGVRSQLAAKLFSELGYPNVVDMTGGYEAWEDYQKNNQ